MLENVPDLDYFLLELRAETRLFYASSGKKQKLDLFNTFTLTLDYITMTVRAFLASSATGYAQSPADAIQ